MLTNKYQILMQLYESKSIKNTAEELSYSQSAVSQALQSIENDLGVKLFIRRKNGLNITNEGNQLYPFIKRIVDAEKELKQDVSSIHGLITGEIIIGSYHTVACSILPDLIVKFRELYPSISFTIREGYSDEIRHWIENDKVNFGIIPITDNEEYISYDLIHDPFYAVLPKGDPKASQPSVKIAEISDGEYIHLTEFRDKNDINYPEISAFASKSYISVDQYETIAAMVGAGMGISILPKLAITNFNMIEAVPLDPPSYRRIGVLVSERQLNSIAVKTFVDFILENLK